MDNRLLGSWGEDQAAKYLRRKGYTIVERNFSCRYGELDIIAKKRGIIAFVEVKLRKDDRFAQAREYVTRAKQQRLLAAAQLWLSVSGCQLQPRFDVIEIYAPQGAASRRLDIRHLENAFSVEA